jgi:hypothetical protein
MFRLRFSPRFGKQMMILLTAQLSPRRRLAYTLGGYKLLKIPAGCSSEAGLRPACATRVFV